MAKLNEPTEPDADLCASIGAGELESLIRAHGVELWPRIEQLARADERFRRALRGVWAYGSPEFERREKLLAELGESWTERVEFVASRRGFGPDATPEWRAFSRSGQITELELAELLRQIVEWLERRNNHTKAPTQRVPRSRPIAEVGSEASPETAVSYPSPEAAIASFLDPSQVLTWGYRNHGDLAVGLVVPARDPDRLLWSVYRKQDDQRWTRTGMRQSPGWITTGDGDLGVRLEALPLVANDVLQLRIHVDGRGVTDEEPVAQHVSLLHWNVTAEWTPPDHQVVATNIGGEWVDIT